jgi:DNA sulfur modification protein DndC
MNNYNNGKRLRKHTLPNAFVYTPIEDLSNNEVWAYLLQAPNPWGGDNRRLLKLYSSACSGGECPFVIETGTQSCGKSRFGCWVCTVVDRDKSMENFIHNGEEWMKELLVFRNWLYDIRQQTNQYVPRSIAKKVKFGPFLLRTRREILDKLLTMQEHLPLELIAPDELNYIQKLLANDAEGQEQKVLKKFIFKLSNGDKLATISDFNILLTPRTRLGSKNLKRVHLIKSQKVSYHFSHSTRVMYYEM